MSRPTPGVPLQSTLNKWVNVEAVMAYAGKLRGMAERDRATASWEDDPAAERRAQALGQAADRLDEAVLAASLLHMAHERAAYDRIYRRAKA